VERGVESALVHTQGLARGLEDPRGDVVAVSRAEHECLEHQDVEGAAEEVEIGVQESYPQVLMGARPLPSDSDGSTAGWDNGYTWEV